MSITPDEIDTQDETGPDGIKSLREKARKADKFEKELEQTRRELAFMRAGIPLDRPGITYFVKGYEGELEPEAIKAAAVEAGFLTQQQDPQRQAQAQAQSRAADLSAGSGDGFDGSDIIDGMNQAFAEGGIEGMVQFGQQYGLRVADE
jgi:hypothetical protein